MKIVNLNDSKIWTQKGYLGNAGQKESIVYDGSVWLVKYPKSTKSMNGDLVSYTTSPLSEYIGSHIYSDIGVETHKTILGERNGKIVVACKDFEYEETKRISFLKDFKMLRNEYSLELDKYYSEGGYSSSGDSTELREVLSVLALNTTLKNIPAIEQHFWDMFVVDTLIANNDRNNGNWGVLVDDNHKVTVAPVYDNGNAFSNRMTDMKMEEKLFNNNLMINSSCNDIISAFTINGKPIIAKKFILGMENKNCCEAIKRIVPKINLDKCKQLIMDIPEYSNSGIPCMSEIRKKFYIRGLELRMEYILETAYEKLMEREKITINKKESYVEKYMKQTEKKMTDKGIKLLKQNDQGIER